MSRFDEATCLDLTRTRGDEIIALVARRRTLKVVASELGISVSTVNYHVRELKDRFGVNSLAQLVDIHNSRKVSAVSADCTFSPSTECAVQSKPESMASDAASSDEPSITFRDALTYSVDAPWTVSKEPIVVPGVLDSTNATIFRGAAIVGIAVGLFILVLLGLGVAQGITAALSGVSTAPVKQS